MRLSHRPSLDPAEYAYEHRVRTRFAETDAMGVIHHANYLLYLEEARVAWLAEVGRNYAEVRDGGIDFAVIESFVQYRRPLHFDDVVAVHLRVGHTTRSTVQIGYLLAVDGEARATAVTVHAAVRPDGRPVKLPTWLSDPAFAGPAT
ncbi:MAG: acyl-CoA thioesterase [Acidimicrobiia bacterium]|nr:acyl-CoA thioesterase [Acidimicrobiia bacterium]